MAGRTLAFSVGVAALLFAGGGVRAVEPQAPGAAATASASTGQTVVNQVPCHLPQRPDQSRRPDSRQRRHRARRRQRGALGEGRPQAACARHAAGRLAAARREHLRPAAGLSRDRARSPCGRGAEPRPHRHVPPAESHRVPERDPRSARARRRRRRAAAERRCELRLRQRGRGRACRRRCSSAICRRRRRSRASRSGVPLPAPASRVVELPADLTQEEHVDGLPFGTRGGTIVRHTFPRDGEYEIQVRLMRNRNENVEGLSEPHQLEVTLDGERLQLFTVDAEPQSDGRLLRRRRRRQAPAAARAGDGRAARVGVGVPAERASRCIETERQPYDRALQHEPSSAAAAGRLFGLDRRAVRRRRTLGDTPSRQRIFVCRPGAAADEAGVRAARSFRRLRAARIGGR